MDIDQSAAPTNLLLQSGHFLGRILAVPILLSAGARPESENQTQSAFFIYIIYILLYNIPDYGRSWRSTPPLPRCAGDRCFACQESHGPADLLSAENLAC